MEIKIDEGIIIEKLNIKNDDTLIFTIDTDIWCIEDIPNIMKIFEKHFPNNNIICKLKGIDLEVENYDINKKTS